MKKLVFAGAVTAICIVAIFAIQSSNKHKTPTTTIKIGSILPLTGSFASFGEEIHKGALLAIDEASQSGIHVEYISEDDQSDASGSVNAAHKLIQSNIPTVFTATVREVKPIAPIFNEAKTPLLAVWDSDSYIKSAGPYIFTIGFSIEGAGEKMADYAYTTLGLRKVAIVPTINYWSESISAAYQKRFEALGGTVTSVQKVQPEERDFRTVLSKLRDEGAEGVYAPLMPGVGGVFINQAREVGFTGQIMMGDLFTPEDLSAAGPHAERLLYTNLFLENTVSLAEKYHKKFGKDPFDPVLVALGYDGIRVLIEAYKISVVKNISITEALTQVDIPGIGSHINMQGKQHSERQESIFQIANKEPKVIKN